MIRNQNRVNIKSPATIANLVCGFDILGMCLHAPYDEMEIILTNEKKVVIHTGDQFHLPSNPELNTAGAPLLEMLKQLDDDTGFEVKIKKNIKPGSGLGSSASSATGAVIGANYLLQNRFSKEELVQFAMLGEKLASGVKHADNVAPGIYGGITLIRSIFPLDIVPITAPPLHITVVHPQIEIKTSDARKILRHEVQLKDAVKQWGNVAGLIAGLMKGDYDLIGRSLEDFIIEPARKILIPGFDIVKNRCMEAGAIGGGISGSGPSLFMLSRDIDTANRVEQMMKNVYQSIGLAHYTYVTTLNPQGCSISQIE